ncbi:hypothetical protein BKA62DRAFT_711749 [Auriculariales sp. MPI-PUGE-AT-0066]|nr:hypothetical protein BKA62DRAFT_711749 [Auriculariales sp. MPI-PUGE-AT-0066]
MMQNSPRKVIPLNDIDGQRQSSSRLESTTCRAFFCGVVVETDVDGTEIAQEVREIVASLGDPLATDASGKPLPMLPSEPTMAASSSIESLVQPGPLSITRKRALTTDGVNALANTLNEFVVTERTYVKHLRVLKESYAEPLRKYARSKDTAIISSYDASTLFGNIDQLLTANEAFLSDLEKMLGPNGHRLVGSIGDVALKHFKELRTFECYRHYYAKRDEAQRIFQREMMKKSTTGFASYTERIKDTTIENGNRLPLRELLIEPVQRIPRYTMMFRNMVKYMGPSDPQRAKLQEADTYAAKIAACETDEQTKRSAALLTLPRTIDGCPADIVSNSRRLIDCIDVMDNPVDLSTPDATSLACTLILFDDKLMLVRRPGSHINGRQLTGLEEVDKANKQGIIPEFWRFKKNGLVCKGVFEIIEVVFTDVGGLNMHMYLEVPPHDPSDQRWSGRQFRQLSLGTVSSQSNPQTTQATKQRFLESVWIAQAQYRTRLDRSIVLQSPDFEVESRGGRVTTARAYYNVYQRKTYLGEQKKSKVILHIDQSGEADPVPFGMNGDGPFVVIRVQPLDGEVSRYRVTTGTDEEEPEEVIVSTSDVPERVVQTIHQFGLFKFQTGAQSRPTTPTANSARGRSRFTLDAISRNLFGASTARGGPSSNARRVTPTTEEIFGSAAIAPGMHRRSRSVTSGTSGTSVQTQTTSDSLLKSSHRTSSTMLTTPDEDGVRASFANRSKSPALADEDEIVITAGTSARSARKRRAMSASEPGMRSGDLSPLRKDMDESEWDLAQRLELARQNSQNHQQGTESLRRERSSVVVVEDTIYEDEPPTAIAERRPMSPSYGRQGDSPTRAGRSTPTRPRGPRTQSRSPQGRRSPGSPTPEEIMDMERKLQHALTIITHDIRPTSPPMTPGRKRMLEELQAEDGLVEAHEQASNRNSGVTVPLSIKKKVSAASTQEHSPGRRAQSAGPANNFGSPKATTSHVKGISSLDRGRSNRPVSLDNGKDGPDRLLVVAETTREDIQSSRRAIKRIKLELEGGRDARLGGSASDTTGATSPVSAFPRSTHNRNFSTQASSRMSEMHLVIETRNRRGVMDRPVSSISTSSSATGASSAPDWTAVEHLVGDAERKLKRAASDHEAMLQDLRVLVAAFKEKSAETVRLGNDLQQARVQCDFVKDQLADVMIEKELMYEAFNKELDGMYNDVNLPDDEAWVALTNDLRESKDARNQKEEENEHLRLELAEARLMRDQSLELLRRHKLIS